MALAVDDAGTVYVLYNANDTKYGVQRMYFRRSTDEGATWSPRRDVSHAPVGANNLFPAIVARGTGDVRIAWQDDRNGLDAGGDDEGARWNTYYRSSTDAGAAWSPEVKLSAFVPGYGYKFAEPMDGYLEPYGDYFELDIDGRGTTHALWGEGARAIRVLATCGTRRSDDPSTRATGLVTYWSPKSERFRTGFLVSTLGRRSRSKLRGYAGLAFLDRDIPSGVKGSETRVRHQAPRIACALFYRKELRAALARVLPRRPSARSRKSPAG